MNNLEQLLPSITADLTTTLFHNILAPLLMLAVAGLLFVTYKFLQK